MACMDNGASSVEHTLIKRAKERKTPINGSLELLPLCNMNCDMCYVRLSGRKWSAKVGFARQMNGWRSGGR